MKVTSTLRRRLGLFTYRAAWSQLVFCLLIFTSQAQAPDWEWAASATGSVAGADVEGWTVAADGNGNVYTTGVYYSDTVIFGGVQLTNLVGEAMYLLKYDVNGTVLWATQNGGSYAPEPRSMATDGAGNVYITGLFGADTLTFGGFTLLNSPGTGLDMFLVKYDPAGNVLWATSAGGSGREWGEGVAVDARGNVFVGGSFESSSVTFGAYTLVNTNQVQVREDVYLVKYDASGNVLWAKKSGGMNNEWTTAVATDPFGNSYICGPYFSAAMSFGTDSLVSPHGDNHDQNFLASYDSLGNYRWSRQVTLTSQAYDSYLYDVAADAFGNVVVSGDCNSDTVFLDTLLLIDLNPGRDMIVAKYDSGGALQWARRPAGTTGGEYGYALAMDASGNAYVSGYFDSDSIVFDAGNTLPVDPYYYSDLFIAKYHPDGHVIWSKGTGGLYIPGAWGYGQVGIDVDPAGRLYSGGCFFYDTLYFDADTVFLDNAYPNIFTAMLVDSGNCSAAFTIHPDTTIPHLYWVVNIASGIPPLSYLWQWGDGTQDTIAFPSHTYATGGFYPICLTITDSTGCTNTKCYTPYLMRLSDLSAASAMVQVNVVASLPTGTGNIPSPERFFIYPNPSAGTFYLGGNTERVQELTLYDLAGKRIRSLAASGNAGPLAVPAADLDRGLYFLHATGENMHWIGKLLKQ